MYVLEKRNGIWLTPKVFWPLPKFKKSVIVLAKIFFNVTKYILKTTSRHGRTDIYHRTNINYISTQGPNESEVSLSKNNNLETVIASQRLITRPSY